MKNIILFSLLLLSTACAHQNTAKNRVEKNTAHFANSKTFENPVSDVEKATFLLLKEKIAASNPATTGADPKVEKDPSRISTGWIYEVSKDKYLEYQVNKSPRRKKLSVRRQYSVTILPSVAGSDVTISVQEEIEDIDLKTGASKGWKASSVDTAAYQQFYSDLGDKIRSL